MSKNITSTDIFELADKQFKMLFRQINDLMNIINNMDYKTSADRFDNEVMKIRVELDKLTQETRGTHSDLTLYHVTRPKNRNNIIISLGLLNAGLLIINFLAVIGVIVK